MIARHFDAASVGRRTDGWHRLGTDANAAASGPTLARLRAQGRDLVRNNPWARRGLRRILSDTIGCGIRPKATGRGADLIMQRWQTWAETTECDAAGRLNFYGLQRLAMNTIIQSGEVLIRRRFRLPVDGLSVPLQLQILEPDFLDTTRDGYLGDAGGPIVQGIEHDALGRRVAYWLFDRHPGSNGPIGTGGAISPISKRVPADGVLHVFDIDRPGQVRAGSWFASVDLRLHDFLEFEDATLVKQKFAACTAAFVTDLDGFGAATGLAGTDTTTGQPTDTIEPGTIIQLQPGKQVNTPSPPASNDHASYSATALRGVAAGLGTTYSGISADYSQANYSSERAARLDLRGDVEVWQELMLIPQLCQPAWKWFLNAMILAGDDVADQPAEWTCQPMAIIDPEKEADADIKEIRGGLKSWAEAVRQRGYDPDKVLAEIIAYNRKRDAGEVVLDSDPRQTNSAGQRQGASAPATSEPAADETADTGDGGDAGDMGDAGATTH
jgi:lambda family phage portal protein